jgi:hypothetical protein
MSGLVNVKYCNAPIMLLYCVLSPGPRGVPSSKTSFSLEDKGVGDDVHFVIPTQTRRLAAYFS